MNLKPCPFCGSDVYLNKVPCENPDCRCKVYLGKNDTVYRDEKTARENAIKQWNRRVVNI